jgi:hypothetical protein
LFSECKVCRSARAKIKYIKNKEHINKLNAKWKADNAKKHRAINAAWRAKNAERHIESWKKWKRDHPVQAKEIARRTARKVRSTPKGRLNGNMSSAVRTALRGSKAGRRWESLVGYTVLDLKRHLEKLFLPGMSWNNYGEWEIDHKIPQAAFNFEEPYDIDFKRCWCLKNLQPLWRLENSRKNSNLLRPFQPSLLLQEVVNG